MITAKALFDAERGVDAGFELVKEDELKKFGKRRARTTKFLCAYEGCGVLLHAVFPLVAKAHFRLGKDLVHIGHGRPSVDSHSASEKAAGSPATGGIPGAWRDPSKRPASTSKPGTEPSMDGTSDFDFDENKKGDGACSGKPAEVSSFRRLVMLWRSNQPHVCGMEFKMPESRARTWGELFVSSEDLTGPPIGERDGLFVVYGEIERVTSYGGTAYKVYLRSPGGDVWIYWRYDPIDRQSNSHLFAQLDLATRIPHGTLYVMGSLNRRGTGVEVLARDGFAAPAFFLIVSEENHAP